ncbi:hypothetical protein ACOSP7_031966 [Xanthoceras sorbifolium]
MKIAATRCGEEYCGDMVQRGILQQHGVARNTAARKTTTDEENCSDRVDESEQRRGESCEYLNFNRNRISKSRELALEFDSLVCCIVNTIGWGWRWLVDH